MIIGIGHFQNLFADKIILEALKESFCHSLVILNFDQTYAEIFLIDLEKHKSIHYILILKVSTLFLMFPF